jgi:hypothetical protein
MLVYERGHRPHAHRARQVRAAGTGAAPRGRLARVGGMPHEPSAAPPPVLSPRWWVSDKYGRVVIGQFPNPALGVWVVATVVAWSGVVSEAGARTLADVGHGALIVWGLDELLRGASPIRRVFGAAVLGWQLLGLLPRL